MHIMTDAIVLREQPIEDYDSVLTLLTRERGVISAYARGVRKPRSALRAATELLSCSCFVLFANKERYSIDKADLTHLFMGIRSDMEKLALASYFCELTMEIAPRGDPADEQLRLLQNSLHLLDKGKRTCQHMKPIYELRLLTMAGYMPNLVGCQTCHAFEADEMYFLPIQAALACGNCIGQTQERPIRLSKGILAAMRHIIYAENKKLFDFTLSQAGLAGLNDVTAYYVICQLERRFPTLDFFKSVCGECPSAFCPLQ